MGNSIELRDQLVDRNSETQSKLEELYGVNDRSFSSGLKIKDIFEEGSTSNRIARLYTINPEFALLYLSYLDYQANEPAVDNEEARIHRNVASVYWDMIFDSADYSSVRNSGARTDRAGIQLDNYLTDRLMYLMNDWSADSILENVRNNLGILSEDDEKAYSANVFAVDHREMYAKLGLVAYSETILGVGEICLPKNYDMRILEHEYVHTQGDLGTGLDSIFFKFFNEVITERYTNYSYIYDEAQRIYSKLLMQIPDLDLQLKTAFKSGQLEDRAVFIKTLINNYKLSGLFKISRFNPFDQSFLVEGNSKFKHDPFYSGDNVIPKNYSQSANQSSSGYIRRIYRSAMSRYNGDSSSLHV